MKSKDSVRPRKPNRKAGRSTLAEKPSQSGLVETGGELSDDGSAIELVGDPVTQRLNLLRWDGANATIAARVRHNGNEYVPLRLEPSFARNPILPTRAGEYARTSQLCGTLRELFARHVDETGTWLLTVFALATWGIDWLPFAPAVAIAGPRREATALLRLLACVCRRSLLLGELSRRSLRTLPIESLHPTLLVASIDPATRNVLRVCSLRGLQIPHGGGLVDYFCSTAICGGIRYRDETDCRLCVSVRPRSTLEYADEAKRQSLIDRLQPVLLRYRFALFARILAERTESRNGTSAQVARSLELLVADDPEVLATVSPLLKAQDKQIERSRLTGTESVVVEALLAACHQNEAEILVSGVAKLANAIWLGRSEAFNLEPRAVGDILRHLGLQTERIGAAGRGLKLDQRTCQSVHELARDYRVPNRIESCSHCTKVFGKAAIRT